MTFVFIFCRKKTISEYARHVRLFIAHETKKNPGFRARHWMGFTSSNFCQLSDVSDYVPPGTGTSAATHKICAYKHLLSMIRAELLQQKGRGKALIVFFQPIILKHMQTFFISNLKHNNLMFFLPKVLCQTGRIA